MTANAPLPGFSAMEFRSRTAGAQHAMARDAIDILLCLSESTVRYFSGLLTPIWQSPTRPWFLLLPGSGMPVAVIPEIGRGPLARSWIDDIRCFDCPSAHAEHVSLLAATLRELAGNAPRIGLMMGRESGLHLPLADFYALQRQLPGASWIDSGPLVQALLQCKSPAEIARIRYVCQCTADAFDALPNLLAMGISDVDLVRRFRQRCLEAGVDDAPYVVIAQGAGGYEDIISPPSGKILAKGDVLMIDAGCRSDGYYCDFNRNFALGTTSADTHEAYHRLWSAISAGFANARSGVSAADLWHTMQRELYDDRSVQAGVGRAGHGLGMQLTETPSIAPWDHTELCEGMVLTLEPSLTLSSGRMLVLEENIVVGRHGAEWLSRRAPERLPQIS